MPQTDTTVSNLIINLLTNAQYSSIASPSDTELYLITDDPDPVTNVKVNGTSIVTNGEANLITNTAYDATNNKIATMADIGASGGGTVTSVAFANATNGGLSVSGSPITSSGTFTVGHTNVLSASQATQAVYPITIDKNGHIESFGTAVTIPTKVSDLTNDSGFISGISSADVTAALGFTPYNATNPSGFISGISSADVTTALGFTPYNASNPSSFISAADIPVTDVRINGTTILSSGIANFVTNTAYNASFNKFAMMADLSSVGGGTTTVRRWSSS